ncbi:MAG: iron-containing redox enzyme family protein [Dermatophilaceae bacterium]
MTPTVAADSARPDSDRTALPDVHQLNASHDPTPSDDGPLPLPTARGVCSDRLLHILRGPFRCDADVESWHASVEAAAVAGSSASTRVAADTADIAGIEHDEDVQLTLWLLYALHVHGLPGVDDRWEWHPELLRGTTLLEAAFETRLRALSQKVLVNVGVARDEAGDAGETEGANSHAAERDDVGAGVLALAQLDLGPSLSARIASRADLGQVREFLVLKSIYQLTEGDPHTFAIPRLRGQAKAAIVEIQSDEYGNGELPRLHSELFAVAMRRAGLDARPGGYVDWVPASVLAADNAIMMFGLHRRLRGAVVGHLAAIEMTSTVPMRRYAQGMRRVGLADEVAAYFDEHVLADAMHEQVARHEMVVPLVRAEPQLRDDVLLGAATAVMLDSLVARDVLAAWEHGASALRRPLPGRSPDAEAPVPPYAGPFKTPRVGAPAPRRVGDGARISICPDGPLLARGSIPIGPIGQDPADAPGRTVALCRCGRSRSKPYCDGTHHVTRFVAP